MRRWHRRKAFLVVAILLLFAGFAFGRPEPTQAAGCWNYQVGTHGDYGGNNMTDLVSNVHFNYGNAKFADSSLFVYSWISSMDASYSNWYQAGFQYFSPTNPYGSPQRVLFFATTVAQQYLVCAGGMFPATGAGGMGTGACFRSVDDYGLVSGPSSTYQVEIYVTGDEATGTNPSTGQTIDYGCLGNVNFKVAGIYIGHQGDCVAWTGGGMTTQPTKNINGYNLEAFRDNTVEIQDSNVVSPTNTSAYYGYSSIADTYAAIANQYYRPNYQNQSCDNTPPPEAGTYLPYVYQTAAGSSESTCPSVFGPYGVGSNGCGGSNAPVQGGTAAPPTVQTFHMPPPREPGSAATTTRPTATAQPAPTTSRPAATVNPRPTAGTNQATVPSPIASPTLQ